MTASNANIFTGPTGTLPVVNSQGQIYEEVQVAILNQVLFNLATFNYTPGTKTIDVFKNGLRLRRAVDYTETSASSVTLTVPCAAGDIVTFKAFAVSIILAPLQNNGVIPAGANGQVLAKNSSSDYDLKWFSLSSLATLLDQPRVNVPSAPTVDVTGLSGTTRNIQITGTTQIDGWAITNGQLFVVKFAASLTLSNNANQVTQVGQSIKVSPGDTCLIRATADNVVEVVGFSKSTSSVPQIFNDHRLTLTTGVPVTIGDVAGAGTLYYTAYKGQTLSLFNGSAWVNRQFNEISIALAGLTVGRPYDVFAVDGGAGVAPTLEILVWASTTARATNLSRQDGVLVKSSDATRRYIGTFSPTAAATTADTKRQRLVWNMYNRVRRNLLVLETAASWVYSTATYRQVNANANNQIEVVVGSQEDSISLTATSHAANTVANAAMLVAIGLNTTVTNSTPIAGRSDSAVVNTNFQFSAKLEDSPAIGFTFYAWLEYCGAGVGTWSGTATSCSGVAGAWVC